MHVTTKELDDIARLGLEDLRSCFSANPPAGALEKAELTLKVLRQGTSRMSGENNRVATALKVARAAGVPAEDQRQLWDQIVGARGGAPRETQEPLAPAQSGTSRGRSRKPAA